MKLQEALKISETMRELDGLSNVMPQARRPFQRLPVEKYILATQFLSFLPIKFYLTDGKYTLADLPENQVFMINKDDWEPV